MRKLGLVLLSLAVVATFVAGLSAAERNKLPLDFYLEPVVTGLDRPSAMAVTEDGRVFIAERFTGNVRLVENGKLAASPVLTVAVATGVDEGLVGIAHDPAGPEGGYLFVYYTDATTTDNKIVRYTVQGATAASPLTLLNFGPSPGHTRVGGGLAVGTDGKLYVSVGDLENPAEAQNDASLYGKVLRLNADGSIPGDNPNPASAVFAKGFRDGTGLATHPSVATVYQSDRGPLGSYDELNAVIGGRSYGWDVHHGPGSPGTHVDPIDWQQPLAGQSGVATYTGTFFPDAASDGEDNDLDGTTDEIDETYADSAFYACYDTNDIVRSKLQGANLDSQFNSQVFFDADREWEYSWDPDTSTYSYCNPHTDPGCTGPLDAGCPVHWTDLAESATGTLYALSDDPSGTKGGLYRVVYDAPGPREVSADAVLPLSVEKSGSDVVLNWENLGRDASVAAIRGASQPAELYTVWEGSLPITGGAYSHAVKTTTDGTAVNDGLLTATITPDPGDRYFLVSAQGASEEGSLGRRSDTQAERPGKAVTDYCNEIGWFENEIGDASKETSCNGIDDDGDGRIDESCPNTSCGPDFPARLLDQYGNYRTLHDFRGTVLHLDISALDCTYCKAQASEFRDLYDELRGRGFRTVTVLMQSFTNWNPIPEANCAAEIQNWVDTHAPGADDYVLCAVDDDGNGDADIYDQYGQGFGCPLIRATPEDPCPFGLWQRCNGTPMNLYFDRNMILYEYICGKANANATRNVILHRLPDEWCE